MDPPSIYSVYAPSNIFLSTVGPLYIHQPANHSHDPTRALRTHTKRTRNNPWKVDPPTIYFVYVHVSTVGAYCNHTSWHRRWVHFPFIKDNYQNEPHNMMLERKSHANTPHSHTTSIHEFMENGPTVDILRICARKRYDHPRWGHFAFIKEN